MDNKKAYTNYKETQMKRHCDDIIDGKTTAHREDGYTNMLNKFGTLQDNGNAYIYRRESHKSDEQLEKLYEGNGIFAKIIDRPSEEAVKHGLDIDFGDDTVADYVEERLDDLDYEDKFATAEKWARLFGGAIIVMLINDGRGLDEPVDWDSAKSIEELRVFERPVVEPDYSALNMNNFEDSMNKKVVYGEPQFYRVYSIYGTFTVHRERCLVFRNGRLPERATDSIYRFWGIPEYIRIKRALRECVTSHEYAVKILERSSQAIYKMNNLSTLLSTDQGEDKVMQRLQAIDMARNLLNSIAIDGEGEDYDFKTIQTSGTKEIVEVTCNMLSAVTNIPQTILFGRSPAGENSTGKADLENYYDMVENIQKQNMKKNSRTIIKLILKQGVAEGELTEEPTFRVKFAALWSLDDNEKADLELKKAQTKMQKAQTAQIYMTNNVVDASEVRKTLVDDEEYDIDEPEEDPDNLFEPTENEMIMANALNGSTDTETQLTGSNVADGADTPTAAAIFVVNDEGKILVGTRRNSEGLCGPGGHIEDGETAEEAAMREAQEEFNIVPLTLYPLGDFLHSSGLYCLSTIYLCDEYSGNPSCDGDEMMTCDWMSLDELKNEDLFPPFEGSLDLLMDCLKNK